MRVSDINYLLAAILGNSNLFQRFPPSSIACLSDEDSDSYLEYDVRIPISYSLMVNASSAMDVFVHISDEIAEISNKLVMKSDWKNRTLTLTGYQGNYIHEMWGSSGYQIVLTSRVKR